MRILLLSDANSIHTQKWVRALIDRGLNIGLFSLRKPEGVFWKEFDPNSLELRWSGTGVKHGIAGKATYVFAVPAIRRFIQEFKPDIVHAHYASSYGLLGVLSKFKPLIISVWGSDVYDFPKLSPVHRFVIRYILARATCIASTSRCMAAQVKSLMTAETIVHVTPFGVDVTQFSPPEKSKDYHSPNITIGTVKTMAHKYGIDTLIEAFAICDRQFTSRENSRVNLRLLIAGDGPDLESLKLLTRKEGIADKTKFAGSISHHDVPEILATMDVFVALSRLDSESFGVAAIEAGAMALPSVVSDAGGLPEVVKHNVTGLVVPRENPIAASEALNELIDNAEKMQQLGKAAREHVVLNYSQDHCTDVMLTVYKSVLTGPVQD